MPTIPNMLTNYQTPLGMAFRNLISTVAAQPTAAAQQKEADAATLEHWKMLGMTGLGEQLMKGFQPDAAPAVGTGAPAVSPIAPSSAAFVPQANGEQNPIASRLAQLAPAAAAPRMPTAAQPMAAAPQMPDQQLEGPSPIAAAFNAAPAAAPQQAAPKPSIDYGQYARDALFSGLDGDKAGSFLTLGNANTYGARDPRTTNSIVGQGKGYNQTAESFDLTQSNDLAKAENTLLAGRQNNADTNATSRANNRDTNETSRANNAARIAAANARAAEMDGTPLDETTKKYFADQVRNGAPLPALGMGKQAAADRHAILTQAAHDDVAAGRTGTDAAVAKQDYAGNIASNRLLGNREASIGTAVHALKNVIPIVKEQLGEVTRSGLYPVDVVLNAAQQGTNDPALAKLAVGINDAVNLHARATNPQGQVTDEGRRIGYSLLAQAHNAEYLGAALDMMEASAERELAAPGQTRNDIHNAQRGVLGGHQPPAANAPAAEEHWARGADGKMHRVK